LLVAAALAPLPAGGSLLGLPTLCGFRIATGLPCPGCGMTRALVCAAHGHWHEAAQFHPMGPAVFVILLLFAAARLFEIATPLPRRLVAAASGTGAALLFLVWVARVGGWLPVPPR
jgi:hypothetical protein